MIQRYVGSIGSVGSINEEFSKWQIEDLESAGVPVST